MSSIRLNRIDAMIAELKSLERVDDESERLKVTAIKYLWKRMQTGSMQRA